jgi:hypothetical protein
LKLALNLFFSTGSEIWGLPLLVNEKSSIESKYDSFIPNKIQIKYVKYILGVDKSATNLAVMSELGLFPLTISAIRAALGFWLHTINMDDTFLVKNAFSDNFIPKDSFCGKIKLLLDRLGFSHAWDNQGIFSKARFLHAVEEKLKQNFIDYWKIKIFDDDNKVNGNKLRTYRKLKLEYETDLEKGRHLNIPVEQRICPLCEQEIEDEYHFIMKFQI